MLATTCDALRERARAYLQTIPSAAAVDSEAFIGGGSLPHVRIPSVAVALQTPYPDQLALRLRRNTVPIVARIESERVLLDLRTIEPEADASVVRALISLLS